MQAIERLSARAGRLLLVSFWVLTAFSGCQQEPAEVLKPKRLDPRSPTQRLTLSPGETHSFEIPAESGQYLEILVNQLGVDLVVTLLDPQGKPLLEVDNPSGADGSRGPERLVWVAKVSGDHGVTVRCRAGLGDYKITVEAWRTPDNDDLRRATAEQLMTRGDQLYGISGRVSRRQSIDAYQEALALFRTLSEHSREADALYRLGRSWHALREHPEALANYSKALRLYEENGATRQQAITLHNLCAGENSIRELEQAFEHCSRALPLWKQVNDLLGLAKSSMELGLVHSRWGETRETLDYYDQALGLWHQLGRTSREAQVLHNRGRLYLFLGEREQAQADLEESLRLRTALGDPMDRAVSLNSLGQLHSKWRQMDQAADLFQQALNLNIDGSPYSYRRGISLVGLGRIHGQSGEQLRAHELFQEALRIFRRENVPDWQARAMLDLGWLHKSQGRTQEAGAFFTRAQILFRDAHAPSSEAEALLGLATVARLEGEFGAARTNIETALRMIEDLRIRATVSSELRADFLAIRQTYDEFYVDLLMEMGHEAEALAASERGRARSLLEMLQENPGNLRQDVKPELVELRRDLERRINEREHRIIRLKEEGLPIAGYLRAEQRSLLREHDSVQARIRAESLRYAALTQPQLLSAAEIQRLALDKDTLLIEYDLGEERSYLWAVTADSLVSAKLPPRREIEYAARRAYDLIRGDGLKSRRRVEKDLSYLSQTLLGPAAGLLHTKKRLLVVGDGVLQYFPFAALPIPEDAPRAPASGPPTSEAPTSGAPTSGAPLVVSHEIVSLPSASILAVLREAVSSERLAGKRPAAGTLAVVADPVFGNDDPRLSVQPVPPRAPYPRLTHAAAEAEAILALVPPTKRFAALGFDANGDVVSSGQLSRYRIVHFATHAEQSTRRPELSRLVLSLVDREGRARDDGLLHTYATYNLDLHAELVVLSACETALGEEVRGEGLLGPARAFLYAGAARVVVSLWKVDDESTAELMKRFYHNLLSEALAPGEALRAAQDSIRREKRWRTPYHWAGFVLQGEWNDMDRGVD